MKPNPTGWCYLLHKKAHFLLPWKRQESLRRSVPHSQINIHQSRRGRDQWSFHGAPALHYVINTIQGYIDTHTRYSLLTARSAPANLPQSKRDRPPQIYVYTHTMAHCEFDWLWSALGSHAAWRFFIIIFLATASGIVPPSALFARLAL